MESREPMFPGQWLIHDIKLGMLGEHKGTNIDMVWLSFSPFKSSKGTSPSSLKRWRNKNVLLIAKDITEDVALDVHKTFLQPCFSSPWKTFCIFLQKHDAHVDQGGWLLLTNWTTNEPHNTCGLYMSAHTWGRNHKPLQTIMQEGGGGIILPVIGLGTSHRSNYFHCEHKIEKTHNESL